MGNRCGHIRGKSTNETWPLRIKLGSSKTKRDHLCPNNEIETRPLYWIATNQQPAVRRRSIPITRSQSLLLADFAIVPKIIAARIGSGLCDRSRAILGCSHSRGWGEDFLKSIIVWGIRVHVHDRQTRTTSGDRRTKLFTGVGEIPHRIYGIHTNERDRSCRLYWRRKTRSPPHAAVSIHGGRLHGCRL